MATEIVFILDRSGSMWGMEEDVIGGFNFFLKEQKNLEDEAYLTTVLFDNKYEVLHNRVHIQHVPEITEKEYFVRGGTALMDAIGKAIMTVKSHLNESDNVLIMINTDGYENASVEYTSEAIKKLVKECERKGWKFIFIGANIDTYAVSSEMGILINASMSSTPRGQSSLYRTMSNVTTEYRTSNTVNTEELNNIE